MDETQDTRTHIYIYICLHEHIYWGWQQIEKFFQWVWLSWQHMLSLWVKKSRFNLQKIHSWRGLGWKALSVTKPQIGSKKGLNVNLTKKNKLRSFLDPRYISWWNDIITIHMHMNWMRILISLHWLMRRSQLYPLQYSS